MASTPQPLDVFPGLYSVTNDADERSAVTAREPSFYGAKPVPVETPEAVDTALALTELQHWIEGSPTERSCWVIDRMAGRWRVGLCSGSERYSASQDATLRGAIRNALMIASYAGCL